MCDSAASGGKVVLSVALEPRRLWVSGLTQPEEKQRTRFHRIHLARLRREGRMISSALHCGSWPNFIDTHPDAIQSPFLLAPQHTTETSYRLCGNRNVGRWSARRPPPHRSTLFLVKCPIIVLAGLCGCGASTQYKSHPTMTWLEKENAPHCNTIRSYIVCSA